MNTDCLGTSNCACGIICDLAVEFFGYAANHTAINRNVPHIPFRYVMEHHPKGGNAFYGLPSDPSREVFCLPHATSCLPFAQPPVYLKPTFCPQPTFCQPLAYLRPTSCPTSCSTSGLPPALCYIKEHSSQHQSVLPKPPTSQQPPHSPPAHLLNSQFLPPPYRGGGRIPAPAPPISPYHHLLPSPQTVQQSNSSTAPSSWTAYQS